MTDDAYNRMHRFVCADCGNQWRAYASHTCPACRAGHVYRYPADKTVAADAAAARARRSKGSNGS